MQEAMETSHAELKTCSQTSWLFTWVRDAINAFAFVSTWKFDWEKIHYVFRLRANLWMKLLESPVKNLRRRSLKWESSRLPRQLLTLLSWLWKRLTRKQLWWQGMLFSVMVAKGHFPQCQHWLMLKTINCPAPGTFFYHLWVVKNNMWPKANMT